MVQKRFVRRGVAKFLYAKTITDIEAGVTRADMTAAVDVTSWVAGVTGFSVTASTIPTPDMGSRFESSIPGNTSVADSSLRLYDDLDTEEVETTFPIEDQGYLIILRKGDKPTTPTMDVYQTRVNARTANYTTDMTPADVTVSFTIDTEPWLDLEIPAATP